MFDWRPCRRRLPWNSITLSLCCLGYYPDSGASFCDYFVSKIPRRLRWSRVRRWPRGAKRALDHSGYSIVVDRPQPARAGASDRYVVAAVSPGKNARRAGRISPRASLRGGPIGRKHQLGRVVRFAYRPFDVRWLYWDPDEKLLDRNRLEYIEQAPVSEPTISAQQKPHGNWQSSQVNSAYACLDLLDRGSTNFPARTVDGSTGELRPNLSASVVAWLDKVGVQPAELFHHIVATLHAPSYGDDSAGALRMDWPRVPLAGHADELKASAKLGSYVAALLDAERDVPGVSSGTLLDGLSAIALPRGKDFKLNDGLGKRPDQQEWQPHRHAWWRQHDRACLD